MTTRGTNNTPEDDPDAAALSELLSALAKGVRAVQQIPVDRAAGETLDSLGGSTAMTDDFSFQRSFPEFAQGLSKAQDALLDTLRYTLDITLQAEQELDSETGVTTPEGTGTVAAASMAINFVDIEDPLLWETCADVCDALLDHVEAHLQTTQGPQMAETASQLQRWSTQARYRATTSYGRMMDGLVDMEKPQDTYQFHVQNSRTEPFIPPIDITRNTNNKPHSTTPYDFSLQPGHGLEDRFGTLRTTTLSPNLVAPDRHVPHAYREEITNLEYRDWQLQAPDDLSTGRGSITQTPAPLEATWVDTEEGLKNLVEQLTPERVREIAVDLEAHSYRSFSGLVCLMQLSFRSMGGTESMARVHNYLIDTIKLRGYMNRYLQPVLACADIVKVMHGADSDIPWLQRDFGLYIVNLFDTGRAARAMPDLFVSCGYANVLHHYADIVADKSNQLADWRQRPLPADMKQYAIQDTHYLLDIYDRMKFDLLRKSKDDTLLRQVLDVSKQVCLIRYAVEPFKPDGYKVLMSRRGTKRRNDLNSLQEGVLKRLWDWRDAMARKYDESVTYVCQNRQLVRLALAGQNAVSLRALQSLFDPPPPILEQHAQEVIDMIKEEVSKDKGEQQKAHIDGTGEAKKGARQRTNSGDNKEAIALQPGGAPSSAFFKPATTVKKKGTSRDRVMSPVLGTEALYKAAGWVMPPGKDKDGSIIDEQDVLDINTTTADEDDDLDPFEKPRRLLSVHPSNKNYCASKRDPDESSSAVCERIDGMGTVRAGRDPSQSPSKSVEDEARLARQNSDRIRSNLSHQTGTALPHVMGFISPSVCSVELGEDEEVDFPIPRSMREIYNISNRNRRNKKTGSPTPERGVTPTSEKEQQELLAAERLLKESGMFGSMYFDDSGSTPGKRARTRTASGRESEESVPPETNDSSASREEDIQVMKEIGWIQSNDGGVKDKPGKPAIGRPATKGGDPPPPGFDYAAAGGTGAIVDPSSRQGANPFFSGAALMGGPLAAQAGGTTAGSRTRRGPRHRQQNRRQERPEKKDGRTHSYRNTKK